MMLATLRTDPDPRYLPSRFIGVGKYTLSLSLNSAHIDQRAMLTQSPNQQTDFLEPVRCRKRLALIV
jgi:hypothetical protein